MKRIHPFGLCAALLLVALAGACENAVTVSGTITVPVEVQQLFSVEQPGKLAIWGTKLNGTAPLPYLCAPSDAPLMVGYQFTQFGCAEEQEIQVRAFRVTGDHLPEVRCGEAAKGSAGGLTGEELAIGTTVIFPGRNGAGCDSASTVANVTVAATN